MNPFWDYVLPFSYGVLFGTVVFALYSEFSKGMGGIMIRPDDTGRKVFRLGGLGRLMVEPLHNQAFWRPENLDINYIVVATTSGGLGILVNNLFHYVR